MLKWVVVFSGIFFALNIGSLICVAANWDSLWGSNKSQGTDQYAEHMEQYQKWQTQVDVLGPLDTAVKVINSEFEQLKLERAECDRDFLNLLNKIRGRHNKLEKMQETIYKEKTNFKLDKEQWITKYQALLYDFRSKISQHTSAQHDLKFTLAQFEHSKNRLHDDFQLFLDGYNDVRVKVKRHYENIISRNIDSDLFDLMLGKIVIEKLDENLKNLRPQLSDFHVALFRGDRLKYDVVKAGKEYAEALHKHKQKAREEESRVYMSQLSHLINEGCFPRSSRKQDYVFMLHGYGNNYGCQHRFKQQSTFDFFDNPWDSHYHNNRIYSSVYESGLTDSVYQVLM